MEDNQTDSVILRVRQILEVKGKDRKYGGLPSHFSFIHMQHCWLHNFWGSGCDSDVVTPAGLGKKIVIYSGCWR